VTEAAPPVAELLNLGGRVALVTGASGGVAGIRPAPRGGRRRGRRPYRSDADDAAAAVDAMGVAGSRAIAASAELLDRAALLSEPNQVSALRHREPDAQRLLPGYRTARCASD
jgi:hypothetical protein